MEKWGDGEQRSLIGELRQGREMAKQLQTHFGSSCAAAAASGEAPELLLQNILSSYENALSMLGQSPGAVTVSESPRSLSGSPRSEESDREFRDQAELRSGKRKGSPRWTQKVQVCPGNGLEGPVDDGYCWRKYGQKDILGAKHPRGYYRCTRRNAQGCLATKQVQRSDDNPTIFEVIYRGRHTCSQYNTQAPPQPETQEPTPPPPPPTLQQQGILMNLKPAGLEVMTENLGFDSHRSQTLPLLSFSLPSTPETSAFGSPSSAVIDGCFSSALTSPATSASNYFSAPLQTSSLECSVGLTQIPRRRSGSVLSDVVCSSSFTSPTTSAGFDSTFDPLELHGDFSFDHMGFFPDNL